VGADGALPHAISNTQNATTVMTHRHTTAAFYVRAPSCGKEVTPTATSSASDGPHRQGGWLGGINLRLLFTMALTLSSLAYLVAQDGVTEATFEAATVKRNLSGAENWSLNPRPTGQFTATNARASDLVQAAFLVQDYQLDGLPAWTRNERYDVVAKLDARIAALNQPPGFSPTWSLALRALVIERFQLRSHREVRDRPVYALTVAREGRLGPDLKPAEFDCDALREQAVAAARSGGASPPTNTPDRVRCGMRSTNGRVLYGGSSLDEFRAFLSRAVGRAVVDRTNVNGKWDFTLTYATEAQLRSGQATDAPDLFTALVEQLGLKLESTTAPVEMLVVDRIERPTPD
jgi:uncharacterized protein (TIGR03435 family)